MNRAQYCYTTLIIALFVGPAFAADLENSIWLMDDGAQRVEVALRAGGQAEITIDEDPDDDNLAACGGTWQADGNALDVICTGADTYRGVMQDDGSGTPVWTRLPDAETGPMRQAFIDAVFAELARLENELADPAPQEEEAQELEPWMMGEPQRASGTGGSFSFGEDGQLNFDLAFEGDMIIFDRDSGAAMKVSSGMSKAEFKALAEKHGVELEEISESEFKAGDDILVFEDDKLTRTRTAR